MSAEKCAYFYFVRHGQTEWNRLGKLQGRADIQLNSVGKAQALQRGLSLNHIDFNHIYSSPLVRTTETAALINGEKTKDIMPLDGLRERGYGDFEDQDYALSQAARHDFLKNQPASWANNPHGIETDRELEARLIPMLRNIGIAHLSKNLTDKPINDLFVTHSGVMRFLINHFGFMSYEKMEHYKVEETACMKVKFDGKDFKIMHIQGFTRRNQG